MQQLTIVLDSNDFDAVKREVAARYNLGQVLSVDNMSSGFSVGDYNHVIFNGYERILTAMVMVSMSGEKFEVRVFPKSIENI